MLSREQDAMNNPDTSAHDRNPAQRSVSDGGMHVSFTHRLVTLVTAFSLLFSGTLANARFYDLPNLGSSADAVMTPAEEHRLGEAFMRRIRASGEVIDEPWVNDYIQHLGTRLTEHSEAAGKTFHFFVLDKPTINAFAGPGGYIGIHSGLISAARSESELAAVAGHEIAHVTQHHLAQFYADAKRLSVPGAALLIASILLGAVGGAQAGIAAAMGSQAALLQHQIDFTRANEKEADAIGIDILAESGYDPSAMATFFNRMGKATRVYNTKLPKFLLTHPISSERIAEAQGRAGRYPYRQTVEDPRFHLLRAWLKVRNDEDPDLRVPVLRKQLQTGSYRSKTAKQFELALALDKAGKPGEASHVLENLRRQHPEQAAIAISLSRILTKQGQLAKAAQVLRASLKQAPENRPVLTALARLEIRRDNPKKAITVLKPLIAADPDNTSLLALLALAQGRSGDRISAYRSLAESYFQAGKTIAAIQQLHILKREFKNLDYYVASSIEARLDVFEQELAAIKARKKDR